ncbi:MAG: hypothetical protein DRP46_01505 [Candidatus Zixiibacteriota bacterium]|nr:MAG: hypothetical protein DRP46_01505 [candidate division Zixibacteria bacterium]
MPTQKQHIKIANINEELGNLILTLENKYQPWAIVAYFYSALHWVDACIAKDYKRDPLNHHKRETYFPINSTLKKIYIEYHQLKSDSESVRYKSIKFNKKSITSIKNNYLGKIKRIISKRVS